RRPPYTNRFPYTTLFRSVLPMLQYFNNIPTEQSIMFCMTCNTFAFLIYTMHICMFALLRLLLQARTPTSTFLKYIMHVLCINVIDRKSTRLNSSHVKISY